MKINHKQACAIIRYLISNKMFGDSASHFVISDTLPTLGELFDEEIKEARIIYRYGMAGKIWNSGDRIYITGRNHNELSRLPKGLAQMEVNEIESANKNIELILKMYQSE
jgi:hypothetical protein